MVEINILPTQEVVRRPRGDMLFFSFFLLSESKKKKKKKYSTSTVYKNTIITA